MNTAHAFGFVVMGLIMLVVPFVAPEWVASHSIYGSEGRAWWLLGMGGLQVCGGLGFALREGLRWITQPRASVFAEERESVPAPVWARETYYPVRRDLRTVRPRRVQA